MRSALRYALLGVACAVWAQFYLNPPIGVVVGAFTLGTIAGFVMGFTTHLVTEILDKLWP